MAMDETDKRLVKGIIWVVLIGTVAYFLPWFGYQEQQKKEDEKRQELVKNAPQYEKYYPPMSPAHYGQPVTAEIQGATGRYLDDLQAVFSANIDEIKKQIEQKESGSRMAFDSWTEIPVTEKHAPGLYFADKLQRHKKFLENDLPASGVDCRDPDMGFSKKYKGDTVMVEMKAKEYLRELYIADKIIRLCMKAKTDEEMHEIGRGLQPEVFMRVVSISPQDSVATGPNTPLIPNPDYDPRETNPASKKYKKTFSQQLDKFIQIYPVEIKLQCDVNSFMRFLYSVRQPSQFLVIRSLEIISPYYKDSKFDQKEIHDDKKDATDLTSNLDLKPNHIIVKMSAAGMDFFDPKEYPLGIYGNVKAVKTQRPHRKDDR